MGDNAVADNFRAERFGLSLRNIAIAFTIPDERAPVQDWLRLGLFTPAIVFSWSTTLSGCYSARPKLATACLMNGVWLSFRSSCAK